MLLQSMSISASEAKQDLWTGSGYEPTDVDMVLQKVSPHVYYVQGPPGTPTDHDGFMSNAGVVITDEGVVVFDTLGTPSLAWLLLSKIREVTDKPVVRVIASHYHADHIYGLQVFSDIGAKILAPAGAKTYLESDAAPGRLNERRESLFPWVNENTRLVTPDEFVGQDTSFTLGGISFDISLLGSTHSSGDLTVTVKPDRVMLAGDLIFEGRIPFVAGSEPKRWLQQLKQLDASKLVVIVPGHGPASVEPIKAVNHTLGYLEFMHNHMGRAVEELTPFDEAYQATDWGKYKNMPAFQVNRMNAYFIYLGLEAASVQ